MTPSIIRAARRRAGLTLTQFAALMDVSPSTAWRWEQETGSRPVGARKRRVAAWLDRQEKGQEQ